MLGPWCVLHKRVVEVGTIKKGACTETHVQLDMCTDHCTGIATTPNGI